MTLADLPIPTNSEVGSFLAVFAALVVAAYYVTALVKMLAGRGGKVEIAPQPIDVRAFPTVATKEELKQMDTALHGRIKRERQEIDAQIRRVEEIAEKRADKLELKIDENTKLTAEMSGQVGQMNQNLSVLTSSVTNFIRDQARPQS